MEHIISYIFIFVMEAIILLQYSSRLFSPKHSLSGRLAILSVLYILLFPDLLFQRKKSSDRYSIPKSM